MDPARCTCADCRAGDALPDRLQGWPGAYQMRLMTMLDHALPPTKPDQALRDACADDCGEFGDPPCWELDAREGKEWVPCVECLRACGFDVPEPIDPAAVVKPLL